MKKVLVVLGMLLIVAGCSRKFKKDYDVIDASQQDIPEWIQNPQKWAEDEDEKDFKSHLYYVVDVEARKNREIACKIARAQATAKIAGEITTFIKNTFGQATHGDPRSNDEELSEYVEESLASEIQAFVVGAREQREYWEKRKFDTEKGAGKNWTGFTCAKLMKISKKNLEKAFKRAEAKLTNKAKTENKELVKKAIQSAQEEYLKI